MEGAPKTKNEFTHSIIGVKYVGVARAKPTQMNDILTGYLIYVL